MSQPPSGGQGDTRPRPDPGQLRSQVEQHALDIRSDAAWQAVLEVAARLRLASFGNCVLIRAAQPNAQSVAGYEEWQAQGRQVRRGERGIPILDNSRPRGYRFVWDISQTNRSDPPVRTAWSPAYVWSVLQEILAEEGFTVSRGSGRSALTDWAQRIVHIPASSDELGPVQALAHETAHVRLRAGSTRGTTASCNGVDRLAAESTAYVLLATGGVRDPSPFLSFSSDQSEQLLRPSNLIAFGDRILASASAIATRVEDAVAHRDRSLGPRVATQAHRTHRLQQRAAAFTLQLAEATPSDLDPRLVHANQLAAAYYIKRLSHPSADRAAAHLAERGIDPGHPAVSGSGLGYAPADWTRLVDHLRRHGFTNSELVAAGLAIRSSRGTFIDFFRDRLVWPVRHDSGAIVGFTGRDVARNARPNSPKYLNSPQTSLFDKNKLLLGLAEHTTDLAAGARPVLVEGPMDRLAILVAEPPDQVPLACMSAALTPSHVQALERHLRPGTEILVAFDSDEAGRLAAARAYNTLQPSATGPLLATSLPNRTDPADLLARNGRAGVLAGLDLRIPLTDLVLDAHLGEWAHLFDHAGHRVEAARSAGGVIAELPPVDRGRQVQRVAELLDLDISTVTGFVQQVTGAPTGNQGSGPEARTDSATSPAARGVLSGLPAPDVAADQSSTNPVRLLREKLFNRGDQPKTSKT